MIMTKEIYDNIKAHPEQWKLSNYNGFLLISNEKLNVELQVTPLNTERRISICKPFNIDWYSIPFVDQGRLLDSIQYLINNYSLYSNKENSNE